MSKGARAFWLFMALVFLATALLSTGYIIYSINQNDKKTKEAEQLQKALADAQKQQTVQQNIEDAINCKIGSVDGSSEAVPEIFKPSGDVTKLETTDLTQGNGATVKSGDCLQVKYLGSLASNGQKFDGNFDQPKLLKFAVGKGQVIKGWDQGLTGMKVGGLRRIVIPSDLGYGASGQGDSIPPNSDLVFVVKLVKIGE